MFKNGVLRGRILGLKSEAVKEGWRKLHSGELHDLYSPDIIRIFRSVGMR
jgi:hypothetical protein